MKSNFNYDQALELLNGSAVELNQKILQNRAQGKEGLLGVFGDAFIKVFIEIRCESDFVALHPEMNLMMETIYSSIGKSAKSIDCGFIEHVNPSSSIMDSLVALSAKFGEKTSLASCTVYSAEQQAGEVFGHYLHRKMGPSTGKIASIVKLKSNSLERLNEVGEIASTLAKQVVSCSNAEMTIPQLLDSEFIFDNVGTLRKFIELKEEALSCNFEIRDLFFKQI